MTRYDVVIIVTVPGKVQRAVTITLDAQDLVSAIGAAQQQMAAWFQPVGARQSAEGAQLGVS